MDIIFLDMLFKLTTDMPRSVTIRDSRCTLPNKYGEDPLADEDEYLCKLKKK